MWRHHVYSTQTWEKYNFLSRHALAMPGCSDRRATKITPCWSLRDIPLPTFPTHPCWTPQACKVLLCPQQIVFLERWWAFGSCPYTTCVALESLHAVLSHSRGYREGEDFAQFLVCLVFLKSFWKRTEKQRFFYPIAEWGKGRKVEVCNTGK